MSLVLDTHAVIWYASGSARLSETALHPIDEALRDGAVVVSAITLIEIIYLVEKERLPVEALERLHALARQETPPLHVAPVDEGVADALQQIPRTAVPDMPDRIIAATALHLDLPLVTRDRTIQASRIDTVW